MKRIVLIASLFLTATFSSFAQGFEKGDVYLNLGVGLVDHVGNGYSFPLNNKVGLPAFNASVDIGIHKWITVGPYLSYKTRLFKGGESHWIDGRLSDKVNESWYYFGARATFQITPFLNEVANTNIPENLDLYAGVLAGVNLYHKRTRSSVDAVDDYRVTTANGHASLLAAGARYKFSESFGVYLEVYPFGYTSLLNTGLSIKF